MVMECLTPEQNLFLTRHGAAPGAVRCAAILAGGAAETHRRCSFDKDCVAAGQETGRASKYPGSHSAGSTSLVAVTLDDSGIEVERVHSVDKNLR